MKYLHSDNIAMQIFLKKHHMENQIISIVLGLGFGDEGKGKTTSYLCGLSKRPLVVRFNGGHNAGHTVCYKGQRHVFSSFGSGTLRGVPTYWSEYCTFNPIAVLNEYLALKKLNVPNIPLLMVNPLGCVTTPYDIFANQQRERQLQHGSVGVGLGTTFERNENHYHLYVQDLYYPTIFKIKMEQIRKYYGYNEQLDDEQKIYLSYFNDAVEKIKNIIKLTEFDSAILSQYDHIIFEGAQGILLDEQFGFFPHVTRSATTSKNAWLMIQKAGLNKPHIYYISRSYLTRHGNGILPNENISPILINNENETNITDEWQGYFRKAPLDLELMKYGFGCDNHFSKKCFDKTLILNCLDQTGYIFPIIIDGVLHNIDTKTIKYLLKDNITSLLISDSPECDSIKNANFSLNPEYS